MSSGFSLFDREASFSEVINQLLHYLTVEEPGCRYYCLDSHDTAHTGLQPLTITTDALHELTELLDHRQEMHNLVCLSSGHQALWLPELKAVLFFQATDKDRDHGDIGTIVRLLVTTFLLDEKIRDISARQKTKKKQLDRKFKVIENKYQAMLEETQRSYKIIQEQHENYSKTLQSEIKLQTSELRKSKMEAEAANVAKSRFLASMSHEIRTPMNGIIGFTEMLLGSKLNEEQKECALIIKRSGEALLGLINNILDFSKVEAGQMTLERIDFDPEITAHDVCEMIRPRLAGKPVEILCRIGNEVPANVKGDPGRFRQVLLNLLANAAKFTERGEIELSIGIIEETDTTITFLNKVRDTGIGIPEDKFDTIFKAFKQADESTTRKYGGTGLGLSICRKIASLMSGDIWVESTIGTGTTFHFTSMMEKSSRQPPSASIGEDLNGKRILIIDDNQSNNEIIQAILETVGIKVTTLHDERQAIGVLSKAARTDEPYDLAIIDIIMPHISGYTLAAMIRASNAGIRDIPLLAYTSSVERIAAKCRDAGFTAFLNKPARRKILFRTISKVLGIRESKGLDKSSDLVTQYTLRDEAKQSIRLLLAEDNVVNQKLACMMLQKAGYSVQVVDNGRLAVETYTAAPDNYDIILMDIQMPEMDGLEATRKLRADGYDVPIIAMTANVMKGDREKCLESGMSDYISKPIKRESVFKIIEKFHEK